MKANILRPVALVGTVATILIGTTLLSLSHHTFSLSGVGSLKCYATGGTEKAC
ncbi:MAG TPA: hypothetical protein VEI98_01790 [Xanthobacteraceae bacterium]|nr:hypothetical protein [Xanthobacteraceae bacterium]